MKYYLALLLFLALPCQAIETDKVAHFAVSYSIAITSEPLFTDHPVIGAFSVGMVPGIAKYLYDRTQPSFNSREKNQDMAANVLGSALGAVAGNYVLSVSKRGLNVSGKF